jgi:hypothetical protein|tara:strand:- start:2206 stop:2376 length:171 start_codon:yes stop_codon:yes gene_type:complete
MNTFGSNDAIKFWENKVKSWEKQLNLFYCDSNLAGLNKAKAKLKELKELKEKGRNV